jgi:hypothetical protein
MLPVEKLRALFWAEIHMRQALYGCRHMLALRDVSTELKDCVLTGIVVTYARSFGENQGLSAIGSEFRNFTDRRLQVLHEALLQARDAIYAHRDMLNLGVRLSMDLSREEVQKIGIHISPKGEARWTVKGPGLPPDRLHDIEHLCDFQMKRFHEASTKMLQHFCKDKVFIPGDYILGETFP